MNQGMPCLNCKEPVAAEEAKVFAGVCVCPKCYLMAERLYTKCEGELRRLLLLLREAIRVAIVEGKLQYRSATSLDEVPKAELLQMIAQLSEKKDAAQHQPPVPRQPGG